jgi:hypothetical protein
VTRKRKIGMDRNALFALAHSLELEGITETVSWGQPTLKAFGKIWFFWNPTENAPVFKVSSFDERDMLIEADPQTFFTTDHHRPHELVLVRPARLDPLWVKENLLRVWKAQAPKRALKRLEAGG